MKDEINVNNADEVVDATTSEKEVGAYLTLVQGNTYSEVNINRESAKKNSQFIVGLWHNNND